MKTYFRYFVLAGLMVAACSAAAGGVPVYSHGEIVGQVIDQYKNIFDKGLIDVHNELMQSALDAVGSPNSFSSAGFKSSLKKTLKPVSLAVSGYDGLMPLLGPKSKFGEIKVLKCGGNVDDVVQRLNETVVYPAKREDRLKLSTPKRDEMAANRGMTMERASTTGLAKAWTVQGDTAKVAEALKDTQTELDKAESQMAAMATILRLQEETQKNLNTRLSIMADDLTQTGLAALEGNI